MAESAAQAQPAWRTVRTALIGTAGAVDHEIDQAVLGLDALDLAGDELLDPDRRSRRRGWPSRRTVYSPAASRRPAASVPSQRTRFSPAPLPPVAVRTTWPLSSSTLTCDVGCRFGQPVADAGVAGAAECDPIGRGGHLLAQHAHGRRGSARSGPPGPARPSLVLLWMACSTEANCDQLRGEAVGIHGRQRILVLQLRGQQLEKIVEIGGEALAGGLDRGAAAGADRADCHGCFPVGSRGASVRRGDRGGRERPRSVLVAPAARRPRGAGFAAPAPQARFAGERHPPPLSRSVNPRSP